MQPKAYNWWEGNSFHIPGLPVRPTYAPAISPSASPTAGTSADMLQQLGFRHDTGPGGIGEGMGRNEATLGTSGAPGTPNAGMGPGAQVTSLGDMAGRVATGVGMMGNPVGLAMGLAAHAGPTPKTSYGWADMLPGNGLFGWSDMLGGGGAGTNGGVPGFDPVTGMAPGVGPEIPVTSEPLGPIGGGGYDGGSYGPDVQAAAEAGGYQGSGMFSKGGKIKPHHLGGPNPPGPDEGLIFAQSGERVIPKHAVKKLEAKHGAGLFDLAINQGKLPAKKKGSKR